MTDRGRLTLALGFGISTPEHVRAAIRAGAAGVICGSAIVRLTKLREPIDMVREFVSEMKAATNDRLQAAI